MTRSRKKKARSAKPAEPLSRAESEALANLEHIEEMVRALRSANSRKADAARERILEDALSVEVRSAWHVPGSGDDDPEEYRILLAWGGPAVRLIGTLDQYAVPETARLQSQDWFQPWSDLKDASADTDDILLDYARCFYFGE